jgi:tetratricopeptide (TPR) repeat protein
MKAGALCLSLVLNVLAMHPLGAQEQESLTNAVALIRQAKPALAIPILESYIDKNAADPAGHFWLGLALDESGDPVHAILSYSNSLQAAAKNGRDSAQLRINIGNTYMRLRKPDEAILNYRRAIELEPESIKAHESLSQALLKSNRPKEALAELDKCAQLGAADPTLNYYRALALKSAGQERDARSQMEVFLKALPNTAESHSLKSQIREIIERDPAAVSPSGIGPKTPGQ